MSFDTTFHQFLEELKLTFPEFASELNAVQTKSPEENRRMFLSIWRTHTSDIVNQKDTLFAEGVDLVPGVRMTKKLWQELSVGSQTAIWKFLSSLLLLGASESTEGWDLSGFQHDLEEMMRKLKDGEDLPGLGNMKDMFEKISKMAETFGFKDFGDMKEKFKFPERMFKGHLAKIIQELVAEFKPEDFGITPELVESDDPAKVFQMLQEMFTQKPEMLAAAAQKIGKKIQAKFQRGEIKREDILAEAEELMKEVSENEVFSSLFGTIGEMMRNSEKSSGNEGSARRREVQERLRKKKAEKDAKKASVTTNTIVHADAQIMADAMAAKLLKEELETPKKKK